MKHDLEFQFTNVSEEEFYTATDRRISILSGSNNCGKTVLLKLLYERLGDEAYLCGPNRYHETEYLPVYNENPDNLINLRRNLQNELNEGRLNRDTNLMPFHDIFIQLTDDDRQNVFGICSDLLGETVELGFVAPGNSMSQSFLSVGGTMLSKSSSGSRLLINLVSLLFCKKFPYLLIDEPELGLTPRIQNALRIFMYSDATAEKYLQHIKQIYIATHSHLFLNRNVVKNNFLLLRDDKAVDVRQIKTFSEFQNLQFNQLGNTFEQLLLPAGFLFVEGKTDHKFVNRFAQLRFPDSRFNIIDSHGDGGVKKKIHDLFRIVGDIAKSPYRERVVVVLDSTHSPTLPNDLEKMGLDKNCIVIWDNNGIEYYYPLSTLRSIFEDDNMTVADISIQDDLVSHNGIDKTKDQLCEEVISKMSGTEEYDQEIENKLVSKLAALT